MAEIVQTLFGVSPESYQQQQSALADQRALQYAKLDPFQQANYAIGRGAYGLAGAIGGALGGQDPELQLISARNSIAKQINFSDLNSIKQGIQMLGDAGDTVGMMQLADVYRKAQESGALVTQRQREALTPEQRNADAHAKQFGAPGSLEYQTAFKQKFDELTSKPGTSIYSTIDPSKYTPASLAVFEISGKRSDLVAIAPKEAKVPRFGDAAERYAKSMFKGKAYDELTDAEAEIVNKRVDAEAKEKGTKVSVNLSDPTATAKASLDVMNKWEQVIKPDVEVAARFKALTSSVALAQAGNPSADGATIFNIGKIYDPSGAVQEGDKNTILGNPSIPQRIQLLAQTVFKGGSLTPDQRADLLKIGNELVKNKENQLKRYQKQYIKKNTALGGEEADIFNPYEGVVIPDLSQGARSIPSDATGTKSNVGPAIPAAPMAPAKQVKKPSGTPGAVNWKDL
jgi:hypothetical protein